MSSSPCAANKTPWSSAQVVLDDNDPRIKYNGEWTAVTGDSSYYWGSSYANTTHHSNVTTSASGLTFEFQGTSFSILGNTASLVDDSNGASAFDKTCQVDGQRRLNASATNLLCGFDNLSDGAHTVTFTVHGQSGAHAVNVDGIQYTPSSAELKSDDSRVLMVDTCDPSIDFDGSSSNWKVFELPPPSNVPMPLGFKSRYKGIATNVHGANLRYNFTGTRVQFMSTIPSINDGGSAVNRLAWADFTVDGDITYTEQVPLPQANLTEYNQLIFDTGELSLGDHTILVTYNGDTNTLPLTLSYMYVHTGASSTPRTSSSSNVPTSKSSIGPILGGVLGGVFGLILCLILAWFGYSRRQRRREKQAWRVTWNNRQRRPEALEMRHVYPDEICDSF